MLLPGLMCDARQWAHQAATLPQKVIHADTTQDDNFGAMASRVLRDAPDRFALAGLSMGGILAFEIWRQAPHRVTHMALLDTNPHAEGSERQSLRLEQIREAANGRLRELAVESLKPLYLAEAHRGDEALLQTVLDMALDLGPDVFRRQSLALMNRVDSVATLETIDCPTLVLCGDEDTLCPLSYHELMAERIPRATPEVVAGCGHLSPMEQPEAVTHALSVLFSR